MATHKPSKLLPLTSQTKLTLTLTLTLILNHKSKLTLEGATNPIKATTVIFVRTLLTPTIMIFADLKKELSPVTGFVRGAKNCTTLYWFKRGVFVGIRIGQYIHITQPYAKICI